MKVILNQSLIAKQGLTAEEVTKIEELHQVKYKLMQRMKRAKKPEILRKLAAEVTAVEFKLQEVWRFERNINYHRFFELPRCACPKLDNADDYPYRQHYSQNCPIHGWEKV